MSFQSLLFLWALPLVAVPVIIHLFHRRRRDVVRWGAMEFLVEAATRRRRFSRWDDVLLMLLRSLAVLALVLALARPLVRAEWFGNGAGRDVILILDDSLSMSRRLGERTAFEIARERAVALLNETGDSDRVRVMLAANGPRWLTAATTTADAQTKDQLGRQISLRQPTLGSAGLLECVRAAIDSELPPNARARYVVVMTDGQAQGWSHEATAAWQSIRQSAESAEVPVAVSAVDVVGESIAESDRAPHNLCIDEVDAARLVVPVGQPLTLTAEVRNSGAVRTSESVVEWESDQASLGVASIPPLDPQERLAISLEHTLTKPGTYRIRCETPYEDQLREDNGAVLVVEAVDRVPILVVDENAGTAAAPGGSRYLLAALGWSESSAQTADYRSVFEPHVVSPAELERTDLNRFACAVFASAQDLTPSLVERLVPYVEQGGGLWVALGEQVNSDSWNAVLYNGGEGLAPLAVDAPVGETGQQDEFVTIHPPVAGHPATALLGDTERLDVDNARIYRRVPFRSPEDDDRQVSVILEGGSGEILAVEGFRGRGRTIIQGFPFDLTWSNLPLCQAYVALVHEWLWYLVQPMAPSRNLEPRQPIVWRHERIAEDAEATLRLPSGQTVPMLPVVDDGRLAYRYRGTQLPGDYSLEWKPAPSSDSNRNGAAAADVQPIVPFHVRRDARESDLAALDGEQQRLLSEAGGVRLTANPLERPGTWKSAPHREPIWSLLLGALLLMMLAEMVLAVWTSRRRFDGSPRVDPASRSAAL